MANLKEVRTRIASVSSRVMATSWSFLKKILNMSLSERTSLFSCRLGSLTPKKVRSWKHHSPRIQVFIQ